MIVVNARGEVLFRSRRKAQFAKHLSGGGKVDLGMVQCHFHCRDGVYDELNIGFRNLAVLDISPPTIQVEAPHGSEIRRHDAFSAVW
eukprot:5297165-Karenia_brevis.AAC.1